MKNNNEDTYSHKGWINSDFFWKRAMAVYGYTAAVGVVIYAVILLVFGIIT